MPFVLYVIFYFILLIYFLYISFFFTFANSGEQSTGSGQIPALWIGSGIEAYRAATIGEARGEVSYEPVPL